MSEPFSSGGATPNVPRRVDLSRVRHELRTPINHILGYTEMLLEEGQLPASFIEDLRRVHSGGRRLQVLIGEYFDEEKFFEQRDLHQLYHELRTPVNHIIGYCELLQEQAEEQHLQSPIADLKKIHRAAGDWLALMEAYLVESPATASEMAEVGSGQAQPLTFNPGLGIQVPAPETARADFFDEGAILIVDDDEQNRDMLARRLRRCGYAITVAASGIQSLALARSQRFDLVLLDMIMPGLDGFQVLAKFKADPKLRETPVIMLSALDQENGIARCIEMGAEDYLAKPFNPVFLRARIGACLEKKRLRDREKATYEALLRSQKHLAAELAEAAAYVKSLLPAPLSGPVQGEWCFQPSEQLGGDAFGYHWIDEDHLAIYLLDVCGHGVGAALLSVAVLNTLRAENLAGVDFRQAAQVLAGLNRVFRMERQNNLFFSMWFGVYCRSRKELRFASAGHPPALLLTPGSTGILEPRCLRTDAPSIGCFDEARYTDSIEPVPPGARLLVFSDGVFEIFQDSDRVGTWQDYAAEFQSVPLQNLRPEERLQRALSLRQAAVLEDDFSFLELRFS
jgi:phosphoserine phosphatase RsbU/P